MIFSDHYLKIHFDSEHHLNLTRFCFLFDFINIMHALSCIPLIQSDGKYEYKCILTGSLSSLFANSNISFPHF